MLLVPLLKSLRRDEARCAVSRFVRADYPPRAVRELYSRTCIHEELDVLAVDASSDPRKAIRPVACRVGLESKRYPAGGVGRSNGLRAVEVDPSVGIVYRPHSIRRTSRSRVGHPIRSECSLFRPVTRSIITMATPRYLVTGMPRRSLKSLPLSRIARLNNFENYSSKRPSLIIS